MKQSRGIRNHNPGNIRHGDPWQGLAKDQPDKDFATFASAAYGIRALARTLITYQDKYGLRTIRQIIGRWAPPKENYTNAYVRAVAVQTGRAANDRLDMQSYADLRPLVEAIIRHENTKGPLNTANTWYDAETIDKGLALAGVEPPKRAAGPVPVTRETVGATATAGVGISQLAEAAPAVVDAITRQQDSLSSGQISRVVVGLVLVALAVFIAWSQVSKHKAGVL
ncbi:hypothetical protein [Castellaniella denitrificans]|uniref:Structural protein P5 n=1 Tax=Castellaniella denitrificans TaxID=56119 RepID=A0ABT4M735_9BURK|nr:hypothetical protein [Castellaniella denitrificans]MCZ4330785.1 hypothetical protein [Castellaniella denitrificans]